MPTDAAISEALKKIGVAELKEKQKEAILTFLQGHDMFVVLTMGYGKSLIYTILPLVFDKLKICRFIFEGS